MGLPVGSRSHTARWLVPAAIASSLLYAWYIARTGFEVDGHRGFSLFDDAMISMRYARNLAHGAGLRWNPGLPPVEGYTNFLWTLWMALLQLLPLSQRSVSAWVSLSSAAMLVANLWLVRGLVVGAGGRTPSAVFAVVFCAVSYPIVFWSLRGLEVGLLAFLVDAAILLAWRAEDTPDTHPQWPLAVVLSAMVLVRDDALVPATIVLAYLTSVARTRRAAMVAAIAVVGALVGHVCFRIAYYGAALPNTYYLKLGGIPLTARISRGLIAILRTAAAELLLPLVLGALAVVARPRHRRTWMLTAIVLGQLAVTMFVGGDAWESWGQPDRFLSVAIPALGAGAVMGAETLWLGQRHRGHVVAFAAALALRACAVAAGDFVPRSFTVSPPVDLHAGLRGLTDSWGRFLVGTLLVAAIAFARPRPQPAAPWLAVTLGLVATLATVGTNWRDYLRGERTARQIQWDSRNAVFGLRLGEVVPPSTRIAVVAAGTVPFFSNLPAVDLLGKNDAHIAREAPLETFLPGHDKRDYAYSLATYEPDLVLELWHHAPEELRAIEALGYRQLPNGMYVRPGCADALVDQVEHGLPEFPFATHRPR